MKPDRYKLFYVVLQVLAWAAWLLFETDDSVFFKVWAATAIALALLCFFGFKKHPRLAVAGFFCVIAMFLFKPLFTIH